MGQPLAQPILASMSIHMLILTGNGRHGTELAKMRANAMGQSANIDDQH